MKQQFFRAGVGAVICNGRSRVLVCERADVPDAWQFPQGGLETSEEPLDAMFREIGEEVGIERHELTLLDRYPEPLAYELPAEMRSEKTGRGQVQYWFLFEYVPETKHDITPTGEFKQARWVDFEWAVEHAVAFRHPVYRRLQARFAIRLAERAV